MTASYRPPKRPAKSARKLVGNTRTVGQPPGKMARQDERQQVLPHLVRRLTEDERWRVDESQSPDQIDLSLRHEAEYPQLW